MKETLATLLDLSRRAGALAAETLIKTGATRSVSLDPGGAVNWTRTAEGGIALRVILPGGGVGFASACGPPLHEAGLSPLVAAAMGAARGAASAVDLPGGTGSDGRGLGIFDTRLHAASPADLEGMLDDAASEALRADPGVRRLESASIAASSSEVRLANSAGFEGAYRQTLVHLTLGVIAGEGASSVIVRRSRTARTLSSFSPALFGDETARLAAAATQGRPPAQGEFPALLSPAAAAEVLRQASRALTAPDRAAGDLVGSRRLTIIDDGRLPGGVATAPFDGEGVPTRRTTLVSQGRLSGAIHDLDSAARCGAESTGNGVRPSFRDAPRRMPTNLFLAPGSDEPGDLIASMGDGFWIQSLRPTPAVLTGASDFVGLASGRWVRDGRPGHAVAGALVTCPVRDLLEGVDGIGNDLTFGFPAGSFGAPSLLVRRVSVRAPWT